MKPENLNRIRNEFTTALKARGAQRGLRVENKNGVGELFIYDVIGRDFWTGEGVSATDVADKLESLKGVKTLNVYVNSPGGSVWDGKAIHAQLSRFEAQKTVYVDGLAASAASFIAMAGDKIVMAPHATMMIHEAMGGAFGSAGDLENTAEVLRMETKSIAGIYARRTGQSQEECMQMMADETWMDASAAKEKRFCDEVTEEPEEPEEIPEDSAPAIFGGLEMTLRVTADVRRARFLDRISQDRTRPAAAARASPEKSQPPAK